MLARGVLGLPRYPVRLLRSLPERAAEPRRDRLRHASRAPKRWPRPPTGCGGRSAAQRRGRRARARRAAPAADVVQRPGLAAPAVRLRPPRPRRGEGGQEPPRGHRQRRRRRDLRRRGAPLADLAHRAAGRPARRPDPGLGAQRGPAGHLRQPDHADERAAVHQRRRPGRAPERDPRGARLDEGAPPRDAGRPAPGRQPLHPPGGVRPRRARDLHASPRAAAGGRPGTW